MGSEYAYNFFGPLWISNAFYKEGKLHRDFKSWIEQGNEIISKYPILNASNEYFYKTYGYFPDRTNWQKEDHCRALLVSQIQIENKIIQILNIHGIWTSDKKGDERTIKECEFVVTTALKNNFPTIIAGDFNLLPETASIEIINKKFINLIHEFKIKFTRPDFQDNNDTGNNIVDYIFVNSRIKVNDFNVIQTDLSDHYPLLLDFDVVC